MSKTKEITFNKQKILLHESELDFLINQLDDFIASNPAAEANPDMVVNFAQHQFSIRDLKKLRTRVKPKKRKTKAKKVETPVETKTDD